MKTSNILTLGILAVIGASIVVYFRKNKLQVVNNTEIDKKIDGRRQKDRWAKKGLDQQNQVQVGGQD